MMLPLKELVEKHSVEVKGVVHIGAHEGQELESYLEYGADPVVWVEANPEVFQTLKERLSPHPKHFCYQFAAVDKDGKDLELNVMENTMCSSILYPKKHLENYPHVPVVKKVQVPGKTIDSILRENGLNGESFNFLNMDIQGSELMALKGAIQLLDHVDYVYSEINEDYFFENCCLVDELEEFLGRWGFERIDKRMHPDGWGDAFYKKRMA